ncbi:Porin P precursor [Planctomycetes bacterium Pan216]|uniref:Porin P n=1 Tax=Kolteria novifilia TaxID=2527975 RepID=A0A518BB70_9BACT|nr:Porin P precursor [Planctomycetes bacterium Pan216]
MRSTLLLGAMLVLGVSPVALASEEAVTRDEMKVLLERLEAAERTVSELRQRLEERDRQEDAEETFQERPEPLRPDPRWNQRIDELVAKWSAEQADAPAAEPPQEKPRVELIARTQIDWLGFPQSTRGVDFIDNPTTGNAPPDRWLFRRLWLGAKGQLTQTSRFAVEIDFADPSHVLLRDAYLARDSLPVLSTVIVGNQKRPLGLAALNSSRDEIFMERPTVVDAFNENLRRSGIVSYGVHDDERSTHALGVYLTDDIAGDGEYTGDFFTNWSLNSRLTRLLWYDEASHGRGYWHLGIANMAANNSQQAAGPPLNQARFFTWPELRTRQPWLDTGSIADVPGWDTLGGEFWLNLGSLTIMSEYLKTWVFRSSDRNLSFDGWYVLVAYLITGEHHPYDKQRAVLAPLEPYERFFLVRGEGGRPCFGQGAWEVAVRYSHVDLSDRGVLGGVEDNVTLAANWYLNEHSRLQVNYVLGSIRDRADVGGYTAGQFVGWGTRFSLDY